MESEVVAPQVYQSSSSHRMHSLSVFMLLFVANWLPRVLVIDKYVTADERHWLSRSATFFWAVQNGEWQSTFLVGHPGVAVMWSGFPAFWLRFREIAGWPSMPWDGARLEAALWQTTSPLTLLVTGRHVVILLISLAVAAMYFPLRRLFDERLAFVAVLFVGWSPFFLSLSILLHPDGMLAAFSLLSVLLLLVWMYAERRPRYLVLSGVVMGIAALVKAPAAIVGVWGALLMVADAFRARALDARSLARTAGAFMLWAGAAAISFTLLWPAMWTAPVDTALRVFTQSQHYAESGHEIQSFFMSQVVSDPGVWFYPVAYLFRASPISLVGLAMAAWCWWRRVQPFDRPSVRLSVAGLAWFALLFGVVMATGAKKFDRYILPSILALDIIAAVGWYAALRWMAEKRPSLRHDSVRAAFILAMALALVHGAQGLSRYPYYGTYFNPLVGGARVAPQVLMVGWGEGLDQAARWIDAREDEPVTVVSWYEEGPLSYFLPGDAKTLSFTESDHYWFDADYLVLYRNQVQRNNPDIDMINHFLSQPADYTVTHRGLELAWVYDMEGRMPPSFTGIHVDTVTSLLDPIDFVAYRVEAEASAPGEDVQITLFLKSNAMVDDDLAAVTVLRDPAGEVVWQEKRRPGGIPTAGWQPREVREDSYTIQIPADAGPGVYQLSTALVDMSAANASDGVALRNVASIVVQQPVVVVRETVWDPPGVSLAQLAHAPRIAPGQTLLVDVTMEGVSGDGIKMSLRLTDERGMTWAQQDKQAAPNLRFELEVPQDAPSGSYGMDAVLYDGGTLAAYANQDGEAVSRLSTVEVHP